MAGQNELRIQMRKSVTLNVAELEARFRVKLKESACVHDDESFVVFDVVPEHTSDPDLNHRLQTLQNHIDHISRKQKHKLDGDDSSYDSDDDVRNHENVSRTTSDTLADEYGDNATTQSAQPGYAARVEFALKLGYTERLVQTALQKLGANPAQNELLGELIKLGAQKCDAPESDASVDDDEEAAPHLSSLSGVGRLRPIVIDGSNVAMSHGNQEIFSCRGIKICVDWFRARGHQEITVFVPKWRKENPRADNFIREQEILNDLERERQLVFTPSRLVGGKRTICYDDRYILRLACDVDGIVVSNDNYRDLVAESPEFRRVVEERILMYSFVNDRFMPPDDPLGRSGPNLDQFLSVSPKSKAPCCPYAKKCTYGNKCKFSHPERGSIPHKSVTERLSEHAQKHLNQRTLKGKSMSLPLPDSRDDAKTCAARTRSNQIPTRNDPTAHDPSVNLHRKLQRQLTLNPANDPRLLTLMAGQQNRAYGGSSVAGHKPLQRHSSTGGNQAKTPAHYRDYEYNHASEFHQQVSRIASAPGGAYSPHQHSQPLTFHPMTSASDSQLNASLAPWNVPGPSNAPWSSNAKPPCPSYTPEDTRHRVRYHLSAIFPEDQVAHVMNLYPSETNAQKLCASILSIFSNMSAQG